MHRDFGAAQHDDEGEAEIHRRGDEIRLEGQKGFVLDLSGDIGQFCRADRHRKTRVLEQQDCVIDHRWNCIAQRLRKHDETHDVQEVQTQCSRRFVLTVGNRTQSAADIFGEIGRAAQADRHDRKNELTVVVVQHGLHRFRQDVRNAEVPEQDLDQHRHIAMVGHE